MNIVTNSDKEIAKTRLKTIESIFPEYSTEMISVASSIDEYSRTFEMMTGRQFGDPTPERISDNTIIELNTIANRIEDAVNSLYRCMNDKTNIKTAKTIGE
jgi:hypothetical protein